MDLSETSYKKAFKFKITTYLYQPSAEAIMVHCADVSFAIARVDHGPHIISITVITYPALWTFIFAATYKRSQRFLVINVFPYLNDSDTV